MALIKMYPAAANSPGTELAEDITAAQTTITVISGSALPDAPNLFTIGSDETAETVKYTGKNGNTLTGCTRGFDGTAAKGWSAGAKVARYFAAYDHNTFIGNITDLDTRVTAVKQTADTAKATADTAKQTADKAETPDGAQQKVDKALQDAKNYTDTTKTSIYQDYSRFPVYCDKTTDGVDATSAKVTLPTLAGSNYVSAGLQFIAHKDIKGAYIQIGTNTTKYKVVSALGGNAIDIKVNQMYSGRINGTDFLLDSGSASGGAAILGGFEEEGTYVATLNPGDIVVGNNNKYAGYRMSFPTLSSDNRGIAFSRETADGEFCVMFNNSATDQNKVAIYQRKKYANFAKIANVDVAPGGDVTCVAMDPDGKYFVVGSKSAPYINIYLRNGLTFNKASNPGTLPS
ncbi:alanine-zipper protein, partial [Paenibacillus sp.]|uniref:alanine-zipper protein n=1 Tax=Paenibacillus sp. TaxID=58172 RepID=UPI00282516F2|nr:hypothetical protein [Paenibacillus sp.]